MLKNGWMRVVVAVVIGLLIAGGAGAVTTEFTGATNSDWHTSTNWTAGIPTHEDYAIIQSGKTAVISANAECDHMKVESTATVYVQPAISWSYT